MFYAITCAVGTLWLTGEGTGGILITFLQYIRTFADRVSQIADQFNSIMLALAGAERIFDVLDTPAEIDEGFPSRWRARAATSTGSSRTAHMCR